MRRAAGADWLLTGGHVPRVHRLHVALESEGGAEATEAVRTRRHRAHVAVLFGHLGDVRLQVRHEPAKRRGGWGHEKADVHFGTRKHSKSIYLNAKGHFVHSTAGIVF